MAFWEISRGAVDIPDAISTMWKALGAIWLVGLAFRRPAVGAPAQSRSSWLLQSSLGLMGFCLLATNWFRYGWLEARVVPDSFWVGCLGFAATLGGCLFAIWARIAIGGNWSAQPSLQQHHALVVEGPYALARHPIYSGLLLAFAGTVLVMGEVRSLLGLALILVRFALKIGVEERLMLRAFPQAYPEYRKRVKALIPGVL